MMEIKITQDEKGKTILHSVLSYHERENKHIMATDDQQSKVFLLEFLSNMPLEKLKEILDYRETSYGGITTMTCQLRV